MSITRALMPRPLSVCAASNAAATIRPVMMSMAERELEGCPDPAIVVISKMCRLSRQAVSCNWFSDRRGMVVCSPGATETAIVTVIAFSFCYAASLTFQGVDTPRARSLQKTEPARGVSTPRLQEANLLHYRPYCKPKRKGIERDIEESYRYAWRLKKGKKADVAAVVKRA